MSKLFPKFNRRLKHRVAAYFYSDRPKPGFTAVPVGAGLVGYVRGALTPRHTTLIGALDWVHEGRPSRRYPDGECFMNSHYAKAKAPKAQAPAIYVAVRGGIVQGVRYVLGIGMPQCYVVDYDNLNDAGFEHDEDYERREIGMTWAELEQVSKEVF